MNKYQKKIHEENAHYYPLAYAKSISALKVGAYGTFDFRDYSFNPHGNISDLNIPFDVVPEQIGLEEYCYFEDIELRASGGGQAEVSMGMESVRGGSKLILKKKGSYYFSCRPLRYEVIKAPFAKSFQSFFQKAFEREEWVESDKLIYGIYIADRCTLLYSESRGSEIFVEGITQISQIQAGLCLDMQTNSSSLIKHIYSKEEEVVVAIRMMSIHRNWLNLKIRQKEYKEDGEFKPEPSAKVENVVHFMDFLE